MKELRLRVAADDPGLAQGQQALSAYLREMGAGDRAIYLVELAFDELLNNVIRHGFRGSHPRPIDVRAAVGDEIVFVVEDDGPPFNPLEVPEPDRPASLEEALPGGWGISLVRNAASRMEYERLPDRNRVVVHISRE